MLKMATFDSLPPQTSNHLLPDLLASPTGARQARREKKRTLMATGEPLRIDEPEARERVGGETRLQTASGSLYAAKQKTHPRGD